MVDIVGLALERLPEVANGGDGVSPLVGRQPQNAVCVAVDPLRSLLEHFVGNGFGGLQSGEVVDESGADFLQFGAGPESPEQVGIPTQLEALFD